MERKHTPIYGIKGKLVSAVAMLLVAIVMVVSSTYAWFTLSTAPEVSGIQTSIGANGALEIWLNTSDNTDTNYTHGNIVELSAAKYGLQNIVLLPSVLQLNDNGTINNHYVSIPQYGANGKFTELSHERTEAGIFADGNFTANNGTGVRAVGVASGLTDRQLAYRNAKYAASTASGQATYTVATSLNTYGGTLGAIVVRKAAEGSPTYKYTEVSALTNIIADLGTAIGYIDTAYQQMIVALAASGQTVNDAQLPDVVYSTVKANFADNTLTLDDIATSGTITVGEYSVPVPTNLVTALTELKTTREEITSANTALTTLFTGADDDSTFNWSQISTVVTYLINIEEATLNGDSTNGVGFDASMDDIASSVMSKGVNIWLNDDAGVYTDIADHCGNYSASVTMTNVKVSGATFEKLDANMKTNSTQSPTHLNIVKGLVETAGEPAGATGGTMPMTEFYGFILDLGFQTNAASSNLLLQTTPVDRIYEDNNNEATQGGGSYMTFAATTGELTNDQVRELMSCIRIVFFDTGTGEIIGYAGLDTAKENVTIGADGVKANMYMLKLDEDSNEYVLQNGENADTSITALTQNQPKNISVFVYLDGENLKNEHVAATAAQSVTGTMNIQFASSAELVPMEYGDLHTPNQTTTTTTTTANP